MLKVAGNNLISPQVSFGKTEKREGKKSVKEFVSDNKVLVGIGGAAAIAATVTGIILTHKSIKLTKEIETLYNQSLRYFENCKNKEEFTRFFDPEISINQLKEIMKLPKKDRIPALKEAQMHDRGFKTRLSNPERYRDPLPQNVQDAINEKDYLKAKKLYIEYYDNLFNKSETAGKTVAESVENVFGKETVVKPHTYSLKEDELIAMNDYGANGYEAIAVTPNNEIAHRLNWKTSMEIGEEGSCHSPGVLGHMPEGDATPVIKSGKANGRHYVSISYGPEDSGRPSYGFALFSAKGGGMTQAQKDLLSIDTSKLSEEDVQLLFKLPRNRVKSNYDAVLSLVQTLAEKYKA